MKTKKLKPVKKYPSRGVYLPSELMARITEYASTHYRSVSNVVQIACKFWLDHKEKEK